MAEPLTLPQAKAHLRVRHSGEDQYLADLITSARQMVEDDTWRAIVRSTRRVVLNRFPGGSAAIYLPRPPLVSVESITYVAPGGATTALTGYRVDASHEPGIVVPAHGSTWPEVRDGPSAVEIVYTAGYADGEWKPSLVQCVRVQLSELYEQRGPAVSEKRTTLDRMLMRERFRDVRIGRFLIGELDRVDLGV